MNEIKIITEIQPEIQIEKETQHKLLDQVNANLR
jgi:hypothetical protein